MDDSRKYDIMELMEQYKRAPDRTTRDYYGKILTKIAHEHIEIRSLREELIKAIRNGDRRRVRYVQEEIRIKDLNRTGGRETIKI